MSHTIIYQTKVIKLEDGRLIHLTRQGCNNDTAGREKGVFDGKLYTREAFEKFISDIEKGEKGNPDATIQIGSRWCNLKDYATHLRRMLKRAVTWEELQIKASNKFTHAPYAENPVSAIARFPEDKEYTRYDLTNKDSYKEFYKLLDKYFYKAGFSYSVTYDSIYEIDKIIEVLEKVGISEFHVA